MPLELRKLFASQEWDPEGCVDKLTRARVRQDQIAHLDKSGKLLPEAARIAAHQLQCSAEELEIASTYNFDSKVRFVKLNSDHANALHAFHGDRANFQIKLFTDLTARDVFVRECCKVAEDFFVVVQAFTRPD